MPLQCNNATLMHSLSVITLECLLCTSCFHVRTLAYSYVFNGYVRVTSSQESVKLSVHPLVMSTCLATLVFSDA